MGVDRINSRGIIVKIIIALVGSVIITCSIYSWQKTKVIAMTKTIHLPASVTKGKVSLEEAISSNSHCSISK